jgi:hypothetical protein
MYRSRWLLAACLTAFLAPLAAPAQQVPHIGYVYPAGGRQGTTFEVKIGGQYLTGVSRVHVSGTGVQATPTEQSTGQRNNNEANQLRDRLRELLKKGKEAEKEIAQIQRKLALARRTDVPAIGETLFVRVTVAPGAPPGPRELRLETAPSGGGKGAAPGLSNPLTFCVGQLPELCEPEPLLAVQPPGGDRRSAASPEPGDHRRAVDITLPAVVNGQIAPNDQYLPQFQRNRVFVSGDVDRYRFQAHKGQQVVAMLSARELVPYLADGVPGWFQATLTLYDAAGKELAYNDDYRFHPDPVLLFKVPADGQYVMEIKDALYRGRSDFVYRLTVGELPFVASIFPLGGPAGAATNVEVRGWNLPGREKTHVGESLRDSWPVSERPGYADTLRLTMDAKNKAPGVYPLAVRSGDRVSNSVPFAVDTLPECLAKEPNNAPQNAQRVKLPVIVNGLIDQPGDWDVFCFDGRAGEEVVAEVQARRLDSPLDSVLRLTDAAGKQLAFNDDQEDKSAGLNTHHADSLIQVTLPADGTYYVHLGDSQHQGGPEYAYRLRLSAPRPDFALRVVPSGLNVRSGRVLPVTVFALRKEGFAGEIALALKDAPEGFALSGTVPADKDQAQVTLTAPRTTDAQTLSLCLEGRATIAGQEVVHAAVPADDMMQAFFYHHLVPASALTIALPAGFSPSGGRVDRGPQGKPDAARRAFQNAAKLLSQPPVKLPLGGTAEVRVRVPAGWVKGPIALELNPWPKGLSIEKVSLDAEVMSFLVRSDAAKAKSGLKGNLTVNAFLKTPATSGAGKPSDGRTPLGKLPAIPFEITKPK